MNIYLATVCLERNRWGSKRPSFAVSDWLARLANDGFDGIELWEHHYLDVDPAEQARLVEQAAPLAVFNSYVDFTDAGQSRRAAAADAVTALSARAVKYNLGGDPACAAEYRRNLVEWTAKLPESCRLLCECHPGTVLEELPAAAAHFEGLDPNRHGAVAHVAGNPDGVAEWFSALGPRIAHVHLQLRTPQSAPSTPAGRNALDACFKVVREHGFQGSLTIEFTRGIGRNEDIEQIYSEACVDLAYCRTVMG